MAVKKVVKAKKVAPVENDSYSKLDEYCIWLDEFYRSLKKAGFAGDVALGIITDKNSYPEWIKFGKNTEALVAQKLEDEDDA